MGIRTRGPVFAFLVLVVSPVLAQTPCGSDPGDAALVTAAVDAVEAQCACCHRGSVASCAVPIVKAAVHGGQLPGRCAARVKRQVRADCALERRAGCGKIGGCFDPTAAACTGVRCFPSGPPGYCRANELCRIDCPPAPGRLVWRATCGAPVCRVPSTPIPGVAPCTANQVAGTPCAPPGTRCDLRSCEALLVCTRNDPTHGGRCPISRRAYKDDIKYLGDAELQRLYDELLKFRLATYRYKAPEASSQTHLGFIIDDVGPGPAVASDGDHVDLYGYASMAVAAVQTQARQIAQLQQEVETLKAQLKHSRALAAPVSRGADCDVKK